MKDQIDRIINEFDFYNVIKHIKTNELFWFESDSNGVEYLIMPTEFMLKETARFVLEQLENNNMVKSFCGFTGFKIDNQLYLVYHVTSSF